MSYRYDLASDIDAEHIVIEIVERNIPYLHQISPILAAPSLPEAEQLKLASAVEQELTFDLEQSVVAQYNFWNLRYQDQELGSEITQVAVKTTSGFYQAFPIYSSEELSNENWDYGASFYLAEEEKLSELYYFIDGQWYKTSLE